MHRQLPWRNKSERRASTLANLIRFLMGGSTVAAFVLLSTGDTGRGWEGGGRPRDAATPHSYPQLRGVMYFYYVLKLSPKLAFIFVLV